MTLLATDLELHFKILAICMFFAAKYAVRKLVFLASFFVFDHNDHDHKEFDRRVFILVEHIFFSAFGYYVVSINPGTESWLRNPASCFHYPPKIPSEVFHWYYLIKIGTYFEDLVTQTGTGVFDYAHRSKVHDDHKSSTDKRRGTRDVMMDIHHLVTAILCIGSYALGYHLIGSLVMLLHDVSEVPLDFSRVFRLLNWDGMLTLSYAATLVTWLYWRFWILSSKVLWTIFVHGNSFILPCAYMISHQSETIDNNNGGNDTVKPMVLDQEVVNTSSISLFVANWLDTHSNCDVITFLDLSVFFVLLASLQCLHIMWLRQLISKGFTELAVLRNATANKIHDE